MSDVTASSNRPRTNGQPAGSAAGKKQDDAPAAKADEQKTSDADASQRLEQRIEDSTGGAGAGPAV